MSMHHHAAPRLRAARTTLFAGLALALAVALPAAFAQTASATPLSGTVSVDAGYDTGGTPGGSYFRLEFPGGGGYYDNTSSANADGTYTLLSQGTTGLDLGTNQNPASPAFDLSYNSLSDDILSPTPFADTVNSATYDFSVATPSTDVTVTPNVPHTAVSLDQTGGGTVRPLTGDLSSWTAYWGGQVFTQGSTSLTSSTWNSSTGAVVLNWTSTVVGGPFNGFTGHWHIEGVN